MEQQESRTVSATITRVLDSGSTFGIVSNTDESLFISSNIAKSARLAEGDFITATIIENTKNANTPWFAIHVHKPPSVVGGGNSPDVDTVLAALEFGPLTTEQLAEELGVNPRELYTHLYALHCDGKLARAGVRAKPHVSDEVVLWGTHKDDFVPVLED